MRGDAGSERGGADYVAVAVALVLGVVLLASVLAVGGNPLRPAEDDQSVEDRKPLNTTATERAVAAAVNRERTEHGLDPVGYDAGLAAVARNHSADMVARGYYAHESPDGDVAFDRVQPRSVACSSVGENIAATWWQRPFETLEGERDRHTTVEQLAEGLVEQWLNSSKHRANMLRADWERTGVGVAVTDKGEVLVTQTFCE